MHDILLVHRLTGWVGQDRSDVTRLVCGKGPVCPYEERARSSTRALHGGRAMSVRVIPKGAGRVILRDVHFVLEMTLRHDVEQHVVAVAGGRNVKAVEVQIYGVETSRPYITGGRAAGILRIETILQVHPQGVARLGLDDGPREASTIRAQTNLVLGTCGV